MQRGTPQAPWPHGTHLHHTGRTKRPHTGCVQEGKYMVTRIASTKQSSTPASLMYNRLFMNSCATPWSRVTASIPPCVMPESTAMTPQCAPTSSSTFLSMHHCGVHMFRNYLSSPFVSRPQLGCEGKGAALVALQLSPGLLQQLTGLKSPGMAVALHPTDTFACHPTHARAHHLTGSQTAALGLILMGLIGADGPH
eukprot:1159292-Pelagomonas_calceolata.AAC.6